MKNWLCLVVTCLVTIATNSSHAQVWPTRPVTLVVPFAAGGGTDVMARLFASRIGEILGQQIVIENVPGAGGLAGALRVAKSNPDGSVLLFGGIGTLAFMQHLYSKPPYDAALDFEAVGLVSELPRVLVTRRDFPARTLAEFIAYSKINHRSMQYGSAGAGSGPHVCAELLNKAIGTRITHVPYRGGAPAMNDLIAGRLDFQCDQLSTALPHINAGQVKALATLALARSPILPDLPTAHEQGLTDFDCTIWQALVFPKQTPGSIVKRLSQAISEASDSASLRTRLEALGGVVIPAERRGPEYLSKFIPMELEKWGAIIKSAGVTAQ
jgi:tripartite-type tricarboxylate transporter receptor subunit TctC